MINAFQYYCKPACVTCLTYKVAQGSVRPLASSYITGSSDSVTHVQLSRFGQCLDGRHKKLGRLVCAGRGAGVADREACPVVCVGPNAPVQ